MYSSPKIVRVIKSRKIRLAEHVAHMRERRSYTGFWRRNLRERCNLEEPGVNGRIILRWIFRKWDVGYGVDQAGSE